MENLVKMLNRDFWKGKKVFLTGHTGFKGSWMLVLLDLLKADVLGYSLKPLEPSLYNIINGDNLCKSVIADIKDTDNLQKQMQSYNPDIVIHMAAQALVSEGYINPLETYAVNVLGTVNVLEAVRKTKSVKAFVNVTTDKVYQNTENQNGYKEIDRLGGYDPYSNSKVCSEMVTSCYRNSFFNTDKDDFSCGLATVRAGNVLGGGDFAKNRLIPDCVRAVLNNKKIEIKSGKSVRPWQHVIEPLYYYLYIAQNIIEKGKEYCTSFNIGPDKENCRPVLDIVKIFCKEFKGIDFVETQPNSFHETSLLILDNSKSKSMLNFKPLFDLEETIKLITDWTKAYKDNKNMFLFTKKQIENFLKATEEIND